MKKESAVDEQDQRRSDFHTMLDMMLNIPTSCDALSFILIHHLCGP